MRLFGTDGIRGIAGQYPMDSATAHKLGRVFVEFLGKKNPKVGVCGDTRLSTPELKKASAEGLVSGGAHVLDLGILPTPAVAFLIKKHGLGGAIMVSASHNPAEENGLKFFSATSFKLSGADESRLEDLFFSDAKLPEMKGAYGMLDSASEDYVAHLRSIVTQDLSEIKAVVDPGNGAAAYVSESLFNGLGMDVVMINNSPDGLNINRGCGAMHPEGLQKEVLAQKADIGVAFDGDADRVILVDGSGAVCDGDYIMAIIGTYMMKEGKLKGNAIVATQYSNLGLKEAIERAGGKMLAVENGDKYVVDELSRKNLNFGGEKAGHIILFDHAATGDGILTALYVMNLMRKYGKKLSELSQLLKVKPQVLVNVEVREKKDLEKMPAVAAAIKDGEKSLGSGGRVFVRYSGTQNLLRIMVEGDGERIIKGIAERIADAARAEVGK